MSKGGRAREGKRFYKEAIVSFAGVLQFHDRGGAVVYSQKQKHNSGRLRGTHEHERAECL
jgi:hypothetical protein